MPNSSRESAQPLLWLLLLLPNSLHRDPAQTAIIHGARTLSCHCSAPQTSSIEDSRCRNPLAPPPDAAQRLTALPLQSRGLANVLGKMTPSRELLISCVLLPQSLCLLCIEHHSPCQCGSTNPPSVTRPAIPASFLMILSLTLKASAASSSSSLTSSATVVVLGALAHPRSILSSCWQLPLHC